KKAEEIIRSDSRKIFLGTALSQNGRLDALIVFIALARMVWRISRVYNQRPTPAEIWSVYSTVSSSAFIAFSIDALDIPSTVTEAMNSLFPAVAPHMAGTSVPFMGNAMHVFTSSMLDGAANGLLAVRAGILTKNAFRFATLDEPASRSMSTKEITQAMLALSKECLGDITIGLKDQVKGMAFNVADNCVEKTKGAAQTVASAVTDTVSSAGSMVARGGTAVVQAVGTGVETTAGATVLAAKTVSDTVSSAGSMVKRGGEAVGDAAVSAVRTVSDTVSSAGSMVKRGGEAVGDAAVSAVRTVSDTVSSAGSMVKRGGEAVGDAAVSAVRTVGGTVSAAGGKVVQGAEAVGNAAVSATSTVVRGGAAVVTGGIDATKKAVQGAGSVIGHFLPFRRGK
ncbi:MAG: DUF697 domain-containing protein, partial [Desulfovibrionaceae bacterium]|nr:DUF697 domain-containing protein [Desulfovibrionaceae bacterium]